MIDERMKLLAGQRLVAGFEGYTVPESFQKLIRDCKIGNVILFRRNIQSAEQLRELCVFLHCLIRMETGLPPMILLDEEGGTVSRLGELGSVSPSAMAQGATGDPENAFRVGRMIGQELRAVGVNFNCAPILDCNTNPKNPVIGVRSFGGDPEKVADFGAAYARGLREAGVIACGKHFPGHGDTAEDSHNGLAVTYKTHDELAACEWIPYSANDLAGCAVMVGHIAAPNVTGDLTPASLSGTMITGYLRGELDFTGLVITDSMAMHGVTDAYSSGDAAIAAIEAGVDIILMPEVLSEAFDAVVAAVENGTISEARLNESVYRVLQYKQLYGIFNP